MDWTIQDEKPGCKKAVADIEELEQKREVVFRNKIEVT